ncbi:MAG: hypothetical protein WAR76_05475 [Xanthobacteraceae bacterium]
MAAQTAAALRQFVIEPIRKRSGALFVLQLSQLITDRCGGRCDALIRRVLSAFRPEVPLPPSRLMDESAIAATAATLGRRGWDILPWRVPHDDIAELRRFAFSTPAWASSLDEQIAITETKIPNDSPRYCWRMSELNHLPAVQHLIADAALNDIAQRYIGGRPLLTNITMWLDPGRVGGESYNAHAYHYDNDGPAFLKFFVYVSDIGTESGPHSFIQGSHHRQKPPQLRRAGLYDRDAILAFYGQDNEMVFTAPAGTVLAEDTAGFHKGTPPRNGQYRLLLQFEYGLLDIPQEEEFAGFRERVRIEGLHPSIKRIVRKFFV